MATGVTEGRGAISYDGADLLLPYRSPDTVPCTAEWRTDDVRVSRTGVPAITINRSAASARITGHDGSNSAERTLNLGARGWA